MRNIKIHNSTTASIKDLSKDLNISDVYWNNFFESLTKLFDTVYFSGYRRWIKDKEFLQTMSYLSEETFIDDGKDHSEILFPLKASSIMDNRRLASKLWRYYEFPCFIFLG
jgi:hypothetical protein